MLLVAFWMLTPEKLCHIKNHIIFFISFFHFRSPISTISSIFTLLLTFGHWVVCVMSSSYSNSTTAAVNSPELKLYQAFIFSVPICFTFIILFVFYVIYLRRGSADLSSLGMRTTFLPGNSISTVIPSFGFFLKSFLFILDYRLMGF